MASSEREQRGTGRGSVNLIAMAVLLVRGMQDSSSLLLLSFSVTISVFSHQQLHELVLEGIPMRLLAQRAVICSAPLPLLNDIRFRPGAPFACNILLLESRNRR